MFLTQFINTGLVILVVNAKITELSLPASLPIFAGQYMDFTVEWYKVVGATITLTMLFNIVMPHFWVMLKMMYKGFCRCWDRGFSCDRKNTRKMLQEDYNELYTGPEF